MAKLETHQIENIENLRTASGEAFQANNYALSIELSLQSWEVLPEPKGSYDESYHIAEGLIFIYIFLKDFENAKKWSEILYQCDTERIDSGERDFISGKIAFEMGDEDKAREFFTLANQKSLGRCFQGEDKKYKQFFGKNNVRPTGYNELLKLSIKEFKQGNYANCLSMAYDAINIKQTDPAIYLLKGKCHYELGELDHAADSLTRAYMLGGAPIFKSEDHKYLEFVKTKIDV